MLTFRAERWGAAANPEEDYGKMWRHYKTSTPRQMRQRWKAVVVEGESWLKRIRMFRPFFKFIFTSDFVVSFSNLLRESTVIILWDMWIRWIVFSVVCMRSDAMQRPLKQQAFTQCFTPRLMCYTKYSHMLKSSFDLSANFTRSCEKKRCEA